MPLCTKHVRTLQRNYFMTKKKLSGLIFYKPVKRLWAIRSYVM